jgi:hypothetical protein
MEREQLKEKFISLLDENKKCEIIIDGYTYNINIIKKDNDIIFYIDNDCIVEYDDIHIDTLNEIYNKISI